MIDMSSSWDHREFSELAASERADISGQIHDWTGSAREAESTIVTDMVMGGVPESAASQVAGAYALAMRRLQESRRGMYSAYTEVINAGEAVDRVLRKYGIHQGVGYISN